MGDERRDKIERQNAVIQDDRQTNLQVVLVGRHPALEQLLDVRGCRVDVGLCAFYAANHHHG